MTIANHTHSITTSSGQHYRESGNITIAYDYDDDDYGNGTDVFNSTIHDSQSATSNDDGATGNYSQTVSNSAVSNDEDDSAGMEDGYPSSYNVTSNSTVTLRSSRSQQVSLANGTITLTSGNGTSDSSNATHLHSVYTYNDNPDDPYASYDTGYRTLVQEHDDISDANNLTTVNTSTVEWGNETWGGDAGSISGVPPVTGSYTISNDVLGSYPTSNIPTSSGNIGNLTYDINHNINQTLLNDAQNPAPPTPPAYNPGKVGSNPGGWMSHIPVLDELQAAYYDYQDGRTLWAISDLVGAGAELLLTVVTVGGSAPVQAALEDGLSAGVGELAATAGELFTKDTAAAALTSFGSSVAEGAVVGGGIGAAMGGLTGYVAGGSQGALNGAFSGAISGIESGAIAGGINWFFNPTCFAAGTEVVIGIEVEDEDGQRMVISGRHLRRLIRQSKRGLATLPQIKRYLTQPIETLHPGDYVLTRDESNPDGELILQQIEETFERTAFHFKRITIRSSTGKQQTILTTAEHPIHTLGKGWIAAGKLKAGDLLQEPDGGSATIIQIETELHPEGVTVYNFRVAQSHTYFVRAEGSTAEPIWVHNTYGSSGSEDFVPGEYPDGMGAYDDVGGHHPLSGNAFNYENYNESMAISRDLMDEQGWGHPQPLTQYQRAGYQAFGETGEPLSITRMAQIKIDAMVRAGISQNYASKAVSAAIWEKFANGQITPGRIPWVGTNP